MHLSLCANGNRSTQPEAKSATESSWPNVFSERLVIYMIRGLSFA